MFPPAATWTRAVGLRGLINIIVVVNRLIKMRYMIPMDLINIILVAECFIKYVFKLHGLPNLIISNYRSQFVSDF